MRWLGLGLLFTLAAGGTFLASMAAAFSVMMFDAPGATSQLLPYVIGVGAPLAALTCVIAVLKALSLTRSGRIEAAMLILLVPIAIGGTLLVFLAW